VQPDEDDIILNIRFYLIGYRAEYLVFISCCYEREDALVEADECEVPCVVPYIIGVDCLGTGTPDLPIENSDLIEQLRNFHFFGKRRNFYFRTCSSHCSKKDRMSSSIFDCCVVNSSSSSSSMSSIFNRFHLDMEEPVSDKGTYYKGIWMLTDHFSHP
jgi:hypothetical protein